MKRALMFTVYELTITPRATGSEFVLSGKKQDHCTLDSTVFRKVLQRKIQRKENSDFFLEVSTNVTENECEAILI